MRCKNLPAVFILSILILQGCSLFKSTMTPSAEIKKVGNNRSQKDAFLSEILSRHPQYFDSLLKQNDKFRIRIIYTQIDRSASNKPVFTNYFFNLNSEDYFYPASTVKMPVAFLALQKLNKLKTKGLDKNSTMITEKGYSAQTAVYNDPTSEDGRPSVAHYIKKIFLASDNEAFNRLYEFLGQENINGNLHKMGYDTAQVLHRLDISMSEDENRHTNPVNFYDTSAKIIYGQPLVKSNLVYEPRNTFLGNGYYSGKKLVNQPFDFSKKNRLTLVDLHSILMSVMFPKSVSRKERFHLKKDDYSFLYKHMSMLPRESKFPQYDSSYSDAYVKFLLYGGGGPISDTSIRIFNKVGDAYGFLTDAAYVVDFKNKVEFLLSATVYCNSDGIFNDDKYDYETVGFPFMKNLGKVIYEHELQRQRRHSPDLSALEMSISK